MDIHLQIVFLFVIAVPVASITWVVTHEELFHEFHDLCVRRSEIGKRLYERKFFYPFTCEYCFSHYVTVGFLFVTRFKLLFPDWRGYLIGAGLSLDCKCLYCIVYEAAVGCEKPAG